MATGLSGPESSLTNIRNLCDIFENPLTVHKAQFVEVHGVGPLQGSCSPCRHGNQTASRTDPSEQRIRGHDNKDAHGRESFDDRLSEASDRAGDHRSIEDFDKRAARLKPMPSSTAQHPVGKIVYQPAVWHPFVGLSQSDHSPESGSLRGLTEQESVQARYTNDTLSSGGGGRSEDGDGSAPGYDIEAAQESSSADSRDALIGDNRVASESFRDEGSDVAGECPKLDSPRRGFQWDRNRCHQRLCALGMILVVALFSSLTSLEFVLPGLDVKLPPKVCSRVADKIIIRPNLTDIVWEGFGTSLGWWANWAGGLPEENRTLLLDDIFSAEKGLGLNIARYNIGGGGYSERAERFQYAPTSFRVLPGFKYYSTSPYNWSQDLNQRTILFGARGRGANVLEAYSYSPPAWMTVSGDFAGADAYKADNLDPSNYAAYAAYMTDVVQAYYDLWGVRFQFLSPVNEPVEGWWVAGKDQEGCNFAAESLDNFLPFVKQALLLRQLDTDIAAIDSWASNTPGAYGKFSTLTRSVISRLNVHSYQPLGGLSYSDSVKFRQDVAGLASSEGKHVHVSEWGPQYLEGSDLDVALIMGRTIALDINVLGARSWSYWQAVEDYEGAPYWGLIEARKTLSSLIEPIYRKQYFVLGQFSKWIVPGSRIIHTDISCNAGLVTAYQHTKQRLILVVINEYTGEMHRTFSFREFTTVNGTARVDIYRTSEKENHAFVGSVPNLYVPGFFSRVLLPKSATTYVISGVIRRATGDSPPGVGIAEARRA